MSIRKDGSAKSQDGFLRTLGLTGEGVTARVVRRFEVQTKGWRASEWELAGNRKATGRFPKSLCKERLSLVSSDLRRENNRTGAFCVVPQDGVILEHVKQPSPVNERSIAIVFLA